MNNKPAGAFSDPQLIKRIISALILAPLFIYVIYIGGIWFNAMFVLIGCLIVWEWHGMIKGQWTFKLILEALFVFIVPIIMAPILLRQGDYGLIALVWLCFVVWGTDVGAYFAGRTIGGAKLMPAVSPNKTWSGAIGGAVLGAGFGLLIPYLFGIKITPTLFIISFFTSIVSQAGDLNESHLKRRTGVKDSSQLIPGHGGVLDRLDGFIPASSFALIVGILHGKDIAKGLLVW